MFGRMGIFPFFLLLCLLAGCAQPKYELGKGGAAAGNLGQGSQEQKASDCTLRFRTSGHCLAWKWEKVPSPTEAGALVFKVYRGNLLDDSPLETDFSSNPSVVLWMPSMGHGSSPTTMERIDVGTYRASNVFFIMPGEWEIRFQVKEGTSVQDEAVVTLTI